MILRQRLGAADHGAHLTYDEFMAADFERGFRYEVIDGMLYVSPWPTLSHDLLEKWVWRKLEAYAATRPDLINFISTGCRFLVPDRPGDTAPSPDLAVYQNLPLYLPDDQLDWRYFSPFLVAEVMSCTKRRVVLADAIDSGILAV
jgi:Uma2 family endonuclease